MLTLKDVEEAVEQARAALPLKALNKYNASWDGERRKKFEEAARLQGMMKGMALDERNPKAWIEGMVPFLKDDVKTGTCLHYAAIAFTLLAAKGKGNTVELIGWKEGDKSVNHAAVIVNRSDSKLLDLWSPKDHGKTSTIFVADPWANIACKTHEYPDRWKARLSGWASKGKIAVVNWIDNKPVETAASDFKSSDWLNLPTKTSMFRVYYTEVTK